MSKQPKPASSPRRPGDRREAVQATCSVCAVSWEHWRRGPVPRYCTKCKPTSHRARDARAAAARGDVAEAKELLGIAFGEGKVPPALRLAAALAANTDPRQAAAAAGLELTDAELEALVGEARAHHGDVVEGRAAVRHLKRALQTCAIDLVFARGAERQRLSAAAKYLTAAIAEAQRANPSDVAGPVQVVLRESGLCAKCGAAP